MSPASPCPIRTWASACAPASSCGPGASLQLQELVAFLATKEIAKYKLPERLEAMTDFPLSTFGKVSKKVLVEQVSRKIADEPPGAAARTGSR